MSNTPQGRINIEPAQIMSVGPAFDENNSPILILTMRACPESSWGSIPWGLTAAQAHRLRNDLNNVFMSHPEHFGKEPEEIGEGFDAFAELWHNGEESIASDEPA